MSFISKCPYCKNAFEAEEQWVGRAALCPSCGRRIVIQFGDESAPGTAGSNRRQSNPPPPPHFGTRAEDIRRNAGETIRETFKLDKLEGFSCAGFMHQVFKRHTWDEIEEYMTVGTPRNIPPLGEVQPVWPAPWLFLRTMLFTLLLYLFLVWRIDDFGVYGVLPLLIIGVIGIPFAALLFFWEVNIPQNISILSLLRVVIVSGFASIAITLVVNKLIGPEHPIWAGPIEETAKALIMLLFIRTQKHRFKLNGLLIGAAVGTGFAMIETGGYVLAPILSKHASEGIATMELRALLAPFMHIPWSAIVGFALWRAHASRGSLSANMMSPVFIPLFAFAVGLHMFWNSEILKDEFIIRTAVVGVIEYSLIIYLIQEGINEVRRIRERGEGY